LGSEGVAVPFEEDSMKTARIAPASTPKRILLLGYKTLAWKVFDTVLMSPDVSVVGVVAKEVDNEAPFWTKAKAKGIPCFSSVSNLGDLPFDLGISVNFWELLRRPLLDRPALGFVNVHHSYNLRFRGRHCTTYAIQRARIDNIWHHGTTLHYISERLDAGKIIASQVCPIFESDTAKDLFERVETLCQEMLKEWLPRVWRESPIPYEPPAEFHTYRNADIQDKHIDLTQEPIAIYDKVRSLTFPPYESPWSERNGRRGTLHLASHEGCELVVDAGRGRQVFFKVDRQ
jgi:methionyl-tRNA formyltransferase